VEEPNSLCFSKNTFIPTDFLAMSYVIEMSRHQVTKLLFQECTLHSEGIDLFLEKVSATKLQIIRYLGFNKRGCTVSEFEIFFKVLSKVYDTLKTLDLASIDVCKPGITKLLRKLKFSNLRTLKINLFSSVNEIPIDSNLDYIEYDSSKVYECKVNDYRDYLWCVGVLTKCFCSAIHYNRHFEMLSYCCNPIKAIPRNNTDLFQRCHKLILIDCGITDETLSELMGIFNYFVNVDTIHLDFNKLTFENSVLQTGTYNVFNNICLFSAQYNSIQDSGAVKLAEALEASCTLETLHLQGNLITEKGVGGLRKCFETHENFHLYVTSESEKVSTKELLKELCGIVFISKDTETLEAKFQSWSHLQELVLSMVVNSCTYKCLQHLKHFTDLRRIILDRCLTLPSVIALAEGLKSCTNLRTLDLFNHNISPDGTVALAQSLKSCKYLQTLYLHCNTIGSDGAVALAESLKSCTNLLTFDLSSNCIGSDGAVALASLKEFSNLQTLNLGYNNICSDGAVALAKSLKSCTHLKKLFLSSNNLGSEGAVALAEGLKTCTNLLTLDLSSNNIDSDGAVTLAEGLKNCTNLLTFDFSSNNIDSYGAVALANGLKSCTNLQTLYLRSKNIDSDDTVAVKEILKNRRIFP